MPTLSSAALPRIPHDDAVAPLARLLGQGWWREVRRALEPAWYAHRRTLPQRVVATLPVCAGMCRHTTAVMLDLCTALGLAVGVANGRCGSRDYPDLRREHTWLITRTHLLDLTAPQFGGPIVVWAPWRTPEFFAHRQVTVGRLIYHARNADPDPLADMAAVRADGALDWLPVDARRTLLARAREILATT